MEEYRLPPTPKHPLVAVAALISVTTVSALGMSIPNVAMPLISDTFGVSVSQTQWVSLAFLLFSSLFMVPLGLVADSVGRVRILLAGIAVFVLSALVAGLAPNIVVLVAARAVMGVGGGAMTTLPVALVRQTVAPDKIGRTMGVIGSSMAAGWALGPAVGGLLAASFGWPSVFFVLVPLGVAAFGLIVWALPRAQGGAGLELHADPIGLLILAVALGSYAVGLTISPFGLAGTLGLTVFGAVMLIVFVLVELRVPHPLVDFRLLARVRVYPGLVTAFLASTIMMTFTVIPPFYLARGLELGAQEVGVVMAVGPAVGILSGVPAGRLVERFGSRPVFIAGLAGLAVAAASFAVLPSILGLTGFLVSAILLTPGNQMFMAANNTAVMARSGISHQGAVSGVLNLFRNLGSITGMAVAASLFDLMAMRNPGPAGAVQGLQVTFAVASVVGLVALTIAVTTGRNKTKA